MRRLFMMAAVVALVAGAARPARADIETQMGSLSGSLYQSTPSQPITGVYVYKIQQFDPTLGTLNTMTIEFSALTVLTTPLRVDNESVYPAVLTTAMSAQFSVSAGLSDSTPVSRTGASSAGYYFSPDSDGSPDFLGPDSNTMPLLSVTGFGTLTKNVEQGAFSTYTGTGSVSIGLKSVIAPVFTALPVGYPPLSMPPAYQFPSGVHFDGTYMVTYEYTPFAAVPEPSNFAMGGIAALLGLGYAWRRRRRMAA